MGGLFETVWIPLVSFKTLWLYALRIQRCPVRRSIEVGQQVEPATLSVDERSVAASYPAEPIP